MLRRAAVLAVVLATCAFATEAQTPPSLIVQRAGPDGELAELNQANEIRVVFSEPMVSLGRIPQPVTAPFVRIEPAIRGTFRWSGTTILIFTPDPRQPLPYATQYRVTVDTSARAVSGRQLTAPYSFRFTTPIVRLLSVEHQRVNDRADRPAIFLLRFNQPVQPAAVLSHINLRLQPHNWNAPSLSPAAEKLLSQQDPAGLRQFRAKVAAVDAVARGTAPISFRLAMQWDTKTYPPSPDLIALEAVSPVQPESWVRVALDATVPSMQGPATPGREQADIEELEPALFVFGPNCVNQCDPSDYNAFHLTTLVTPAQMRAATSVTDVTGGRSTVVAPSPTPAQNEAFDRANEYYTLEDLRFATQAPMTTYAVRIAASLEAEDGQRLGYTWLGLIENWHERAFTSFGDGHGVWEQSGGNQLPFFVRNFQDIRQWVAGITTDNLMPTILRLTPTFRDVPPGDGRSRTLSLTPDRIQSVGIDVTPALNGRPTGLVWAAVQNGNPIPQSRGAAGFGSEPRRKATIVQVTNLGVTVKDSPLNTLIFVTRLDTGEPVSDARVSIVRRDNQVFWRGSTNAEGIVIAPNTPLRNTRRPWELAFIVLAEKDGDVAYVGSDWTEGISSWEFGIRSDIREATPQLRGSVFTDRGVYRLGEQVHVKAILRSDTSRGIQLLPAGTPVYVTLRDSQYREIETRTIRVNEWSSADWTFNVPGTGSLGNYSLQARLDQPRPEPTAPVNPEEAPEFSRAVTGSFLVAAYRRPDFRVDATLTAGPTPIAGDALSATVSARYLFGAAVDRRPVQWTTSRQRVYSAPPAVLDKFLPEQWTFVGYDDEESDENPKLAADSGTTTAGGEFTIPIQTTRTAGRPYSYVFEAEVEDVSRQRIAGRASRLVHPAPWYVGVKRVPYFVDQKAGVQTALIAVTPEGTITPGVTVTVALKQIQWNSVRRAEGGGFYTWDTERRVIDVGSWSVTTGADPAPLTVPLPSGGSFMLTATARDQEGRSTVTTTSFYSLGAGYTAWMRYDHNRIDLVPERASYKPGDTARIMIQSPWERATALLTTEREGIRTERRFTLTSTQQTVTVPITEADIPNVYVSVLLVKGRSPGETADDASDPGKPSFRLGYVELQVEDASKRLSVDVTANRQEYRPANNARVDVMVKDAQGKPAVGEVTLWAVDYGVLSLTGFQTPDVLRSVYVPKALQVSTEDNRQRIVSRRALIPKGADDGGGGGSDAGAGTLRRDFRVLAFWVGSTVTDSSGKATLNLKLPESLTTYRIMAVSGDKASRFGWGQSEIRVNKPVALRPAFPRFLSVGDRATFGSVVTNQLSAGGQAIVTIKSLDPAILRIDGAVQQRATVGAGQSAEVRFTASALAIGRARVQMTVRLNGESDAYEDVLPVEVLVSPETVAAYGQTEGVSTETLALPSGVLPGFGGLSVEMSSTALTGLGEGARYLLEYPYGCAEQKGSRALALVLAADLGSAFRMQEVNADQVRPLAQSTLRELETFQCGSGGFAYWPGACSTVSPYLTSYVLHIFHVATERGYTVDAGVVRRAQDYLQRELQMNLPAEEGARPAYLAWQAFAVKVLVDGGRAQDSTVTRLLANLDRMPVFALAHLYEVLATQPARAAQRNDVLRRLRNAISEEGGSAHVEELTDPYLMWFWNSNIRSTAITLGALVRNGSEDLSAIRPLVRWLVESRQKGRWGNTQENAWALEALVDYYRKYESVAPDFVATASLGSTPLVRRQFAGRSTEAFRRDLPLSSVPKPAATGAEQSLKFEKQGTGTLFYTARLRYAVDQLFKDSLDQGMLIERSYAPYKENVDLPAATRFNAGDLVRVTLRFTLTKERRYVAVTDPLPAGFEPVESWFATTASDLARAQDDQNVPDDSGWRWWWERGGFDHVERHDDRVLLFATRLSEGVHEFSYIVRATTAGVFRTAPARAEEMYEPEVFGRTATAMIEVR
ncbi:MAG TPA: MG2 domain-containing protein [Vicinamibacterales bacterium]|nr:MG2 domain-containing protein [Vicinamibacterales bacterium]